MFERDWSDGWPQYKNKYHSFYLRRISLSRTAQLQYRLIEFSMAFFSPILVALAIISKAVATPLDALDTYIQISDGSNAGAETNFISDGIDSVYGTPVDLSTSQANINGFPDRTESTGGSSQDKGLDGTFAVMANGPTTQPKDTPIDLSASHPPQTNNLPALDASYQPANDADVASQTGSCTYTTASTLFKRDFQPCCDPIDDEPRTAYCCPGGHVEYAQVRIGCVSCMLFHAQSRLPITSAHGIFTLWLNNWCGIEIQGTRTQNYARITRISPVVSRPWWVFH